MTNPDAQLEHLLSVRDHLTARAQGWTTDERLGKVQEECAELIAAIARYRKNPSPYLREKMAEEFVGVEITLNNVCDEFIVDTAAVTPRQLLRFKGALERDGL